MSVVGTEAFSPKGPSKDVRVGAQAHAAFGKLTTDVVGPVLVALTACRDRI